jgi:hypothetical protein
MRPVVVPLCWLWIGGIAAGCAAADTPSAGHAEMRAPVPADPSLGRTPALESMVHAAVADAARRARVEPAWVAVVLAEAVTWPDSSLGCPQPGRSSMQVLVPGYRIRLSIGQQQLEYHAGASGEPFFCPAERATPPAADRRV